MRDDLLVDQFIQAAYDAVSFIHYIEDFYGKDGLCDIGATLEDCKEACIVYLTALATNGEKLGAWGDGDTVDRERVRLVLEKVLNCTERQ